MKHLILVFALSIIGNSLNAQVAFSIFEPASISGGYEFTSNGDGPNWGLANLDDPADAVTASVIIADDGTPGINAQGVPFANEACATVINDLTGKIAIVYRWDGASDNDCYGGTKVLNAQNAGAIGVIMVNRDNSVYGYNGTDDGPLTNIPFAFVTKDDGAIIREQIEAGEDVIAFIGNKLGLYDDDAGIVRNTTVAPTISATTTQTSLNATEFGFDLGTTIYNYGSNTQSDVMITATVTGPSGTWSETSGPYEIITGDSIEVFTGGADELPRFSFDDYPTGTYTLDYEVSIEATDESSYDNMLSYTFVMSDSMVSYCKIDEDSQLPVPNRWTRSGSSSFVPCMVYENDNASRLGAKGMYFVAQPAWNVDLLLEGEEIGIILYKWDDEFVDLDDSDFGFDELDEVAEAIYLFGEGEEEQVVYSAFEEPVLLESNQRYLACVQVWNPNIWIGYSTKIDYTQNIMLERQPLSPTITDGDYFALGFGEEMTPAMALAVFNADELNIEEDQERSTIKLYPNPSTNVLNIAFENANTDSKEIRIIDLSGRTVRTSAVTGSINSIDVSMLQSGQYIVAIEGENGTNEFYKFTKI